MFNDMSEEMLDDWLVTTMTTQKVNGFSFVFQLHMLYQDSIICDMWIVEIFKMRV